MQKLNKKLFTILLISLTTLAANTFAVVAGRESSDKQKSSQQVATTTEDSKDKIVKPKLKNDSCGEPVYPVISKLKNEQGKVGVKLLIDETGKVIEGKVAVSSGFAELDEGAVAFLSLCKFEPATKNGVPIQVWYPLNHRWVLADDNVEQPIAHGDYNFEDPARSVGFMGYVRASCSEFVKNINDGAGHSEESLGLKKLSQDEICACVEKNVKADNYFKLLLVEPAPEVGSLMDENKFSIYSSRKIFGFLMQCSAKSIDASVAGLDPRKK